MKNKHTAKVKAATVRAMPHQHKTAVDLLMILIRQVHRWLPDHLVVLVVDVVSRVTVQVHSRHELALTTQNGTKPALHWQ